MQFCEDVIVCRATPAIRPSGHEYGARAGQPREAPL